MKNLSNNNMDNIFQAHFNQTRVSVDNMDNLWAAIEEERAPSKKRPLLWWALALGGLVLAASLAYSSFSVEKEEPRIQKVSPIASSTPNTSNQEVATAIKEIAPNQTPVLSKENKALIETKSINKNTKSTNINLSSPIPHKPSKNQALILNNKAQAVNNSNTTPFIKPENSTTISAKTSSQELRKTKNISIDEIASNQDFLIENIPTPPVFNHPQLIEEINKTKWDKCQVKQPGSFFIKGYGQGTLPFEKITYQAFENIEETPRYHEDWSEKFSPFMSYSGGLQIGYTFPWKGYLSGGLAYQHFQTKYEESQRVVEQITIYDEMAYFYIDEMGETVWVADSVQLVNIYDQKETHANNHQLWHIPIQFGYIADYNKFRIGGNIEALINISKSYEGYFMQANRSIVVIDSATDKDYMSTNLGVSVSGGLYMGYRLGKHWETYLSPRFRFNQASFLDKSQALHISRNFAGLRAGLTYHF